MDSLVWKDKKISFPIFSRYQILAVTKNVRIMAKGGIIGVLKRAIIFPIFLAREQLKLGLSVVVDAVNPVQEARDMWRKLAENFNAKFHIIECTLEPSIHKRRIEERVRSLHGIPEITWERVETVREEYLHWQEDRLVLDTANSKQQLLAKALDYIRGMNPDDGEA